MSVAKEKRRNLFLVIFGAIIFVLSVYFFIANQTPTAGVNLEEAKVERSVQQTAIPAVATSSVRVPILIYHSVSPYFEGETEIQKEFAVPPEVFEAQLKYLKDNHYRTISFDDLTAALTLGRALPPKPVIISFDDAWQNQFKNAFPLLQKYQLTATFFIFSNAPDHQNFLTWDEVRQLQAAGMTIGGHSKSHPYLATITDLAKLKDEIVASKKIIEEKIGRPVTAFAYPFGRYNDQLISVLKEAGYTSARSTYRGIDHGQESLFTLTGFLVPGNLADLVNFLKS